MKNEEKCILDANRTTNICSGKDGITISMVNKMKKEFVSNLEELAVRSPPNERGKILSRIDQIKKDPKILDISIPNDSIKALGKFDNGKDESILAVNFNNDFVEKEQLSFPFVAFGVKNENRDFLEKLGTKKIPVITSLDEFSKIIQKG